MKRFFLFILFIAILYSVKPFWEEPVSKYVDISFLEPVDAKIDSMMSIETLSTAIRYISDTADKAVHLLSSRLEEVEPAEEIVKPILKKPVKTQLSIHNIELGSPEEKVTAELGVAKSHSKNEYGTEWYTYHEGYHNFVMISFDDKRRVNAIYTNDDLISSKSGIRYGSTKSTVRETFGEPIKEIRKGLNIYVLQESEGFDVFKNGDTYTYVYYDLHQDKTVTAIQLIAASLEQKKPGIYASGDAALRNGFEQQLFDLTNAARVRHGLNFLKWDGIVSDTARKHSTDMAVNDYFNHENKQGKSPFDRMEDDGIKFRGAGENLAYGQSSSIFAHEGLMNSAGHRENILLDKYSHLGTGVAFNEKSQPFYTENFLLK
ncbi:CAP-associated domain-containing protein [Filibacter tadaridae]|uniref:Cysteine-rich secretory protein family protein n=1 Tax=Filibacter tadaridae TaxID=2483811 RepID=A0A3P5WJH7_9BACL|nr:CAP-associated domain-containing protein [Filibacter tadaridae]VDC20962.1 Cysteine-rich secretory protein family protein [Filibacter tadaridae]